MSDTIVEEVTPALMAAYADHILGMERTEPVKAREIAEMAFSAAFPKMVNVNREQFLSHYVSMYEKTWDLLEQKVPEFFGFLSLLHRAGYDDQYSMVNQFAEQLVYTANLPKYFPGVTYPGKDCKKIVLTCVYYLFCGDVDHDCLKTEQELQHHLLHVSAILRIVLEKDIAELLQDACRLYLLLLRLFKTHTTEVEAMITLLMQEGSIVRQSTLKGMIFLQEFIMTQLPEHQVQEIIEAFGPALQIERGVIPAGSRRSAYCIEENCAISPDRVGSISLFLNKTGTYELSIFACQDHIQAAKKYVSKQGMKNLVESVLKATGEQEVRPVKVTWFSTKEEIRQIVAKQKYLIDRYRIQQHEDQAETRDEAIKIAGDRGRAFFNVFVDGSVDLAKKYELPDAPTALLATLPPSTLNAMADYLKEAPTWIRLHNPIETTFGNMHGFCFGLPNDLMFAEALKKYPLSRRQQERMYELLVHSIAIPDSFGLDIMNDMGEMIWSIIGYVQYLPTGERKVRTIRHEKYIICGNPACRERDAEPCEQCTKTIEEQLSYFVNALRIIQREFAPEHQGPLERKVVNTTRKEPDPEKLHKVKERTHTDEIYVVSMKGLRIRSSAGTVRHSRGSWIDMLDPNQIIHVPEHVNLRTRRLFHQKFWRIYALHDVDPNSPDFQGFEITVKAHERSVPMKIETLKKRVQVVD